MNLKCAVIAAAKGGIAEVVTCLHGSTDDEYCYLIRGTKVRKMHTSRRDAFRPINDLPIAKVYNDGKIEYIDEYRKAGTGTLVLDCSFEDKTAMVLAYPGADPGIIDYYLDKGYKGMVISATGLGNLALNNDLSFEPGLKRAKEKGVPVIITTQTIYGRVHPLVYTTLRRLSVGLGCIYVEDMLPEVAYCKLGWVLGHTTEIEKVKQMMQQDIAGEITERTDVKSFLY
jgi:glutamyl-tRNA(Gln) amidotransferase subunit D